MAESERSLEHCRVWLPKQLCVVPQEERRLSMVGWVSEGVDFLDVVVVAGLPTSDDFSADFTKLQSHLNSVECKLPATLRAERKLCVVGEYHVFSEYESAKTCSRAMDVSAESKYLQDDKRISASLASLQRVTGAWTLFVGYKSGGGGKRLDRVPNLYRIIRDDCYISPANTHIIVYGQPQLGSHYFSCLQWNSSHKITNMQVFCEQRVKKPVWLSKLEQERTSLNMEIILMKLNCARFIAQSVQQDAVISLQSGGERALNLVKFHLKRLTAVLITVWATFLYCVARSFAPFLSVWPPEAPLLRNLMQKSMLLQILHIRCRQLMAWPFMLLWGGLGPEQPNVANAERVAIPKHTTWFSLLVDKIAGVIVGCLVLNYHSRILSFLVDFGQNLTNDVLRTGCVWLMGVPAGFKINTELAAMFGTLSLHWIQTWSTLLFTSIPAIKVLLFVLGLSGIVMGFTVFASLVADMVSLSTIHVLSLHDAIGFIYSNQLRALASLFRLFRGRKRNVLRGRLDSFDCSVEQLLVGSLMFTPLLLLLPTTSVFYTFFSIIFMTVSSIQLSIHYVVSIFLSFPFYEVAIWFRHPKRFPSGVWLRILQLEKSVVQISTNRKSPTLSRGYQKDVLTTGLLAEKSESFASDQRLIVNLWSETEIYNSSQNYQSTETADMYSSERAKQEKTKTSLISTLEIRSASFGELLKPFLVTHYFALQWPSAATLAFKIVSGERFSGKLHFGDFSALPHIFISAKNFAQICYTSITG